MGRRVARGCFGKGIQSMEVFRPSALVAALFAALCGGSALGAEEASPEIAHPPIGVFGESVHQSGEVKLSYRLHIENQNELMEGAVQISPSQIQGQYPDGSVPQAFRSYAHVIELAWKPSDSVTLFVTVPFLEKKLDQTVVSTGERYKISSRGFGDVVFNGLYRVFADENHRVHLSIGLSLPSGSTNESTEAPAGLGPPGQEVPAGSLQRLPYIMQLGSGTLSLRPGFTYNGLYRKTFWGAQVLGVLEAGTNSEGYKAGNVYSFSGWVGRHWKPWLRTSFRAKWKQWFDPTGADDQLDPALSPLANTSMQAGQRLDLLFGVDFYVFGGRLKGSRFSIEAGLPTLQELKGPQLGTSWLLTTGLQYAF